VPKPNNGADALGFASLTPTYADILRWVLTFSTETDIHQETCNEKD
jgi:hypothetical protein